MLIAISQRHDKNKYGKYIDCLENTYVGYFEKFGIKLLPISNSSKDISGYFEEINIKGIILSGGNDINPKLYGGILKEVSSVSKERDVTEKKILDIAVKKRLPVLGICRGAQFINVYFKGNLIQNVKRKTGFNHVCTTHNVAIVDHAALQICKKKEFTVNSYHNHGIANDDLSKKLKPFAISNDGLIEGFYHTKYPVTGILWHPERECSDEVADKKLIKAFLNRKLFLKEK